MAPQAADLAPAAAAYQGSQARTAAAAAAAAIGIWRLVDGKNLDASWALLLPRMLMAVARAQMLAAAAGVSFLGRMLTVQEAAASGAKLNPAAFAGLTGDGRPMGTLLYTPVALSKQRIGQGVRIADALAMEELHLAMLVRTQVQDTGRMALQSQMAADPAVRGYVRKVNLPACARCIILSGRFYRYSDGFLRHPNCDCTMIPAAGEHFVTEADPAKLIARMQAEHPKALAKSLTEGDLKALEHGANLGQVVNAHRGMTTAAGIAPGRKTGITNEGTTVRGTAGKRLIAEAGSKRAGSYRGAQIPRLTPAQVFEEASLNGWDRTEIVRQLTRFGYII